MIINDGGKLSLKMSIVMQMLELTKKEDYFYVFRKPNSRFEERYAKDKLFLSNTLLGNVSHILLMILKNPKNLHDGLLRRFYRQKNIPLLLTEDFLSTLSQALSEYFGKPASQNNLVKFLKNVNDQKVFLIDEFVSIRLVNLGILKHLGKIIYVSQDVANQRYDFGENPVAATLIYKLERDAVKLADLVVACSRRDCLKYLEMGAKKAVYYPNIYPIEFEYIDKDDLPSISIVLKRHWGKKSEKSIQEILQSLSLVGRQLRVYLIGIKPSQIPKNVNMQHFEVIADKVEYFKILSKSWIGINIGIHRGGTNQRKYDYAIAGLFVLSDTLGARGDLLPRENTFIDSYDLAAKLEQLLALGKETINQMGAENRKTVLSLVKEQRKDLLKAIKNTVLTNN